MSCDPDTEAPSCKLGSRVPRLHGPQSNSTVQSTWLISHLHLQLQPLQSACPSLVRTPGNGACSGGQIKDGGPRHHRGGSIPQKHSSNDERENFQLRLRPERSHFLSCTSWRVVTRKLVVGPCSTDLSRAIASKGRVADTYASCTIVVFSLLSACLPLWTLVGRDKRR